MKKTKKITALFLFTIMVFSLFSQTLAVSNNELEKTTKDAQKYLYETVTEPYPGSIGGEWCVFALANSNLDIKEEYFLKYYENLQHLVKNKNGVLHEKKYTEYSRTILALKAIGKDPCDVDGYNLILPLADFEKTVFQGINGAIWALISLDYCGYDDQNSKNVKEKYLNYILENQNNDGGWSLSGEISDPDVTAMALTALSKYKNVENVSEKINKALNFINESTEKGFQTSETISQIILAYCELKISVKNELLDEFFEFCSTDGGFKHLKNDTETNLMATEQAVCALTSLEKFLNGEKTLYEKSESNNAFEEKNEFPNRNPDIKMQSVIYSSKTFEDIQNHENKTAIEELSKHGIINGKSENTFDPEGNVTRAEFATIISKALGLTKTAENKFFDVNEDDWFYNYVNIAYFYKIINGVSENEFNPNGNITKEEACTMIKRTAELCGDDTKTENARDILCVFSDYIDISDWAFEAMGYCVKEKIVSDSDFEINSKKAVKRGEVSQMIYNLLFLTELI